MDPSQRERILASLFLIEGGEVGPLTEPPLESDERWRDEWRVSDEELGDALKRMRAKQRAPGPNDQGHQTGSICGASYDMSPRNMELNNNMASNMASNMTFIRE